MDILRIFHERQVGNYCRCHALNNLLGFTMCKLNTFLVYCDDFDVKHNFEKGSSKRHFIFYNYGNIDNIFGYVLQRQANSILEKTKKNMNALQMIHYDFYTQKKELNIQEYMNKSNLFGFIVYTIRHTYAIRKIEKEFYLIDSMRPKAQKLKNFSCLTPKGIGYIEVYSG